MRANSPKQRCPALRYNFYKDAQCFHVITVKHVTIISVAKVSCRPTVRYVQNLRTRTSKF